MTRVREALAPAIAVDDEVILQVHASIGHVMAGPDDSWDELIERADLDMYRVKHLVRGSVTESRQEIPSQR